VRRPAAVVLLLSVGVLLPAGSLYAGPTAESQPPAAVAWDSAPAQVSSTEVPSTAGATPPELQALQQLGPDSGMPVDKAAGLRYEALKEVAYTLGVQTGVRWRYEAIDRLLEANRSTLDRVFDFRPLMLHDGRVAPAVVDRTEGAYRIVSATEARQTEATYTIEEQARLVTRPPDWRDYLVQSYPTFTQPDPAMLPRDTAERKIWASAVSSGWREGVAQADRLFDAHLARLRRGYLGMSRCKLLALQGVVDIPLLAEKRLGVTVNGRMLSVGERVFRIPSATGFEPVGNWKPILQYIPATPGAVPTTDPLPKGERDTSQEGGS
jgi:defect in organelle trafficking protein DotC